MARGGGIQQYHYKFNSDTLKFLKQVEENGFGLGCRDMLTYRILKNNGLENVIMTGCAAWYSDINMSSNEIKRIERIKKIVISDPGNRNYDGQLIKIYDLLRNRYSTANIEILCHRGINFNDNTLSMLSDRKVEFRDISGSGDGFKLYDDADIHVGFRVHAHLYNLSIGNRSILVEEDSRGNGANESLGLPSIKAYSDEVMCVNRFLRKGYYTIVGNRLNPFVEQNLDAYLDILESNEYQNIKNAYDIQRMTYKNMKKYVSQLKEGIKPHDE